MLRFDEVHKRRIVYVYVDQAGNVKSVRQNGSAFEHVVVVDDGLLLAGFCPKCRGYIGFTMHCDHCEVTWVEPTYEEIER